jgi:hypothetical protein
MAWWRGQPEAWAACRSDQREPATVMPEYVAWLKGLPGKPVFVGYPAAYDFLSFTGISSDSRGRAHSRTRRWTSRATRWPCWARITATR